MEEAQSARRTHRGLDHSITHKKQRGTNILDVNHLQHKVLISIMIISYNILSILKQAYWRDLNEFI